MSLISIIRSDTFVYVSLKSPMIMTLDLFNISNVIIKNLKWQEFPADAMENWSKAPKLWRQSNHLVQSLSWSVCPGRGSNVLWLIVTHFVTSPCIPNAVGCSVCTCSPCTVLVLYVLYCPFFSWPVLHVLSCLVVLLVLVLCALFCLVLSCLDLS